MGLDYKSTQAAFQEELDKLSRLRERVANRLARVDGRIEIVSSAAQAFDRAFSVKSAAVPHVPTLTPPSEVFVGRFVFDGNGNLTNSAKEADATQASTESQFEITASIREILQEGGELSAPSIRDALVARGWEIEAKRYKNPLAIVHEVLKRLIKNDDVGVTPDHWNPNKKLFYDKRMAVQKQIQQQQERAEQLAREEERAIIRADIRSALIPACREILRSYPKGISAMRIYRQLRKGGFDMSSYSRPASGIAYVLTGMPEVSSFKVDDDGVIRTYYKIVESNATTAG